MNARMLSMLGAQPVSTSPRVLHPDSVYRIAAQARMGDARLGDQWTDAIQKAVTSAIQPMIPILSEQLLAVVAPAAEKAAEIVGPVVEQKLQQEGPKLAIITGLVLAAVSVVSMIGISMIVVSKMRKR